MRTGSPSGREGNKVNPGQKEIPQGNHRPSRGRLWVVGIGPGSKGNLTLRACEIIEASDSIVGYKSYVESIGDLTRGKEIFSFGMGEEIERCKMAIDLAAAGRKVSLVSGGDPGIYGMAGLVLQLLTKEHRDLEIAIVPGISALNAAASLLGAPLMHDFAVISLSDLLTPWEKIEKRIRHAAEADFVIVIYNPKSQARDWQIERCRDICLQLRDPRTPVGLVRYRGREEEEIQICDLAHFCAYPIDMLTTVFIGNSQTFASARWIITPRGYNIC